MTSSATSGSPLTSLTSVSLSVKWDSQPQSQLKSKVNPHPYALEGDGSCFTFLLVPCIECCDLFLLLQLVTSHM